MSDTTFKKIEAMRGRKGVSSAKLCKHLGIAESTYFRWLSGVHSPSGVYKKVPENAITYLQSLPDVVQ